MKTLVIQLARFGDIYQTWPSLNALLEQPENEVHLLVRERFVAATKGLNPQIHIHQLRTKDLMESVLLGDSTEEAMFQLQDWLEQLDELKFDRIVNLSFSPFSSYLTSHFESRGAEVFGYTRHGDGFLHFHDDTSAYFYAQVGVDRANQIHLTQIFSMVCGVELNSDHIYSKSTTHLKGAEELDPALKNIDLGSSFIVHLSASDLGKALDQSQIHRFIQSFLRTRTENLIFIGLESERELIQKSMPPLGSERVFDLTGKTSLSDLFSLIGSSKGFIGCDSAPLQIASLVNAPILNFRNEHVNSFESGPFSERFKLGEIAFLNNSSDESFVSLFNEWLCETQSVMTTSSRLKAEQWKMIKAIYMGEGYPICIPAMTAQSVTELVEFLPKVYEATQNPGVQENLNVLNAFDLYLQEKEKHDPILSILIRWFDGERIRIPPASVDQIKAQASERLNSLYLILSDWVRVLGEEMILMDESSTVMSELDNLIKHFRFMNLKVAIEDLQKMLPRLITPSSTQVRDQLESALRLSDYSRVADVLEYELKPHLQERDVIL